MTLDGLHVELVQWLLREGLLQWRAGARALLVEDSWRGRKGVRRLVRGQYVAKPVIRKGVVDAASVKHWGDATIRIGKVSDLRAHFDEGRCTHLEIREVLALALANAAMRAALGRHLAETTRLLVVDEIFDADTVDIDVACLAADVGVAVSLIGDPWQAVYEFRGADPTVTDQRARAAKFEVVRVARSFRFRTTAMADHASALRGRRAVSIPSGAAGDCDVVLGSEWGPLLGCDPVVLPLSFGTVRNQSDAALLLLLDHVIQMRVGRRAVYLEDAHAFLRTEGTVARDDIAAAGTACVANLMGPNPAFDQILADWRTALRQVGVPVQLRKLDTDAEAVQVDRLRSLAASLATPISVPGLTVHQAKGGEWPRVGLRVTPDEESRLKAGLDPAIESDRVLYVAATRAMDSLVLV